MDLVAVQIRIALLIGFVLIAIIQSGMLLFFWKKISVWQRCYAGSFILIQLFVIDVLREGALTELGFRVRLIFLMVALVLLTAQAFVPLRRRKQEVEAINTDVFSEKKKKS